MTPPFDEDQRPDVANALHIPLGAVSPLWILFAGAAGAGIAYWWLTRWRDAFSFEPAPALPAVLVETDAAAPMAQAMDAAAVAPPEPDAPVAPAEPVSFATAAQDEAAEAPSPSAAHDAAAIDDRPQT